jgi:amino acid transporter
LTEEASTHKQTVFVREATGLVKNVSILEVIAMNLSDMSAGAALSVVGFTMLLLPTVSGVNIAVASVIAFAISIPQVIVYTLMTRRISRTGGDYVWVSRSLGGAVGNISALMGFTFGNIPYFSLIALSAVFAIGSVGLFFNPSSSTLLGLALPGNLQGSLPDLQFAVGLTILVVLLLVNVFRPKVGFRLVSALMIIGIATALIAIFTLLVAGHNGVVNYMNSLGNSNLTYSAVASKYSGPSFNFYNTLLMVPFFAFFTYPWINAGPAIASEIKSKGAIKWNIPISAVIVFALVTGSYATMYFVGGYNFITSAFSNSALVNNYSFNFWTLAMGVSGNSILELIIGLGWILWLISIIAYGIIIFSRYMFAQAFDRYLPSKFAYVNRYGSPVVGYVTFFGIVVVFIAGASFLYGTISSLYGIIVANMAYFGIVGLAAAVWGIRKERGAIRSTLVIAGILEAAVFSWLVYMFLDYPSVWGATTLAYGYVVATVVLGIVIYFASKQYHMSKGIDIGLTFKEIPPE